MQPQSSLACVIPLSRGLWALVDRDDFDRLNTFKWSVIKSALTNAYYARRVVQVDGTQTEIRMNRAIVNAPPDSDVDHINGDTLDNRKSNLRVCSHERNCQNRGPQKNNSSGFKGVAHDRNRDKWQAHITAGGKQKALGRFSNAIEAAHAYDTAARNLHGAFAHQNFPGHTNWPHCCPGID